MSTQMTKLLIKMENKHIKCHIVKWANVINLFWNKYVWKNAFWTEELSLQARPITSSKFSRTISPARTEPFGHVPNHFHARTKHARTEQLFIRKKIRTQSNRCIGWYVVITNITQISLIRNKRASSKKRAARTEALIKARWYNHSLYCRVKVKVNSFVVCVCPVALIFELFRSICLFVSKQRQSPEDCLYFKYWFMCLLVLVMFLRNLSLTFCLYRLSLSMFPLRWWGIGTSLWSTWLHRARPNVHHHLLLRLQTVLAYLVVADFYHFLPL